MARTNLGDDLEVRITSLLKDAFPSLAGIWLFGSRARGDFRNDSDIDLFVEIDSDERMLDCCAKGRVALFPLVREGHSFDLFAAKPGSVASAEDPWTLAGIVAREGVRIC